MFDLTEDVTYVGEYGLLASLALRAGTTKYMIKSLVSVIFI